MEFQQLSVRLNRADAPRAEALLNLAEPLALSFDDAAASPLFEPAPGEAPLWPQLVIHALFPAGFDCDALSAMLRSAVPTLLGVATQRIDQTHWERGLEQAVFVRRIAENLSVVPAGWDAAAPSDKTVQLHMGLAFGTGRHATTRLCLEWLAAEPPRGLDVCDFGCGSGILAIAALRLGAASAIAIDNDPQAVAATTANAQLNNVAARLRCGSMESFPHIAADIVVANILAGTLNESMPLLAAMLRPGGRIALSGVLESQAAAVQERFAERFASFATRTHDGWACITARLR